MHCHGKNAQKWIVVRTNVLSWKLRWYKNVRFLLNNLPFECGAPELHRPVWSSEQDMHVQLRCVSWLLKQLNWPNGPFKLLETQSDQIIKLVWCTWLQFHRNTRYFNSASPITCNARPITPMAHWSVNSVETQSKNTVLWLFLVMISTVQLNPHWL